MINKGTKLLAIPIFLTISPIAAHAQAPQQEVIAGRTLDYRTDRARADRLILKAVPLLISSDYGSADPLLLEAKKIYEGMLSEFPVTITGDRDGGRANLIGRAAFKAFTEGNLNRASFLYFFQAAYYPYGRESRERDAFESWDAERLSPLSIVLYKQNRIEESESVLRIIANSNDQSIRQTAIMEFSKELYDLKTSGKLQEAKSMAKFAVDILEETLAANDPTKDDLAQSLSELLYAARDIEGGRQYSQVERNSADGSQKVLDQFALGEIVGALITAGNLEAAVSKIEKYQNQNPNLGKNFVPELLIDSTINIPTNLLGARIQAFQKAIEIYDGDFHEDQTSKLRAISMLASTFRLDGDDQSAEKEYRRALSITNKHLPKDSIANLRALGDLADTLTNLAKPSEANIYYRRAWSILDELDNFVDEDTAYAAGDLVSHLLRWERLDEAEAFSKSILKRALNAPGIQNEELAIYFTLSGMVNIKRQDIAAAEKSFRKVVELEPSGIYSQPRISAYDNLSYTLEQQGQFDEAEKYRTLSYEAAKNDILSGGAFSRARLDAGKSLAVNLSKGQKQVLAEKLFTETLETAKTIYGADNELVVSIALAFAEHHLSINQFDKAYHRALVAYRGNKSLFGRLSPSIRDDAFLQIANRQAQAAWTLAKSGSLSFDGNMAKGAEIFDALQRTEISSAGAALARGSARTLATKAGAEKQFTDWQAAKTELNLFDEQNLQSGADVPSNSMMAERRIIEIRMEQASKALTKSFPGFFDLIKGSSIPLTAFTGKKSLLRKDEALIILNPGNIVSDIDNNRGLVFVVTREGYVLSNLDISGEQIVAAVSELHKALSVPGSGETAADGFDKPAVRYDRKVAFGLFESLFGNSDVKSVLSNKSHWTIAPQGALMSLPFGALVQTDPLGGVRGDIDPQVLRDTKWLGIEKALAIVPSVSALQLQRNREVTVSPDRQPFFGIGDPAFSGIADPLLLGGNSETRSGQRSVASPDTAGSYFSGNRADLSKLAQLDRLAGTNDEIRRLASLLGAGAEAILLQLDAKEEELFKRSDSGELAKAEIVAFATHGLLNGQISSSIVEPSLALTPPLLSDERQLRSENDGLLTASEAASLRLNAKMVILSACNTASGGDPNAEGLSGLAKAFFYAGAQSLLVSHFPVYDFAAPELTIEALKLQESGGISAAEAMRKSMSKMLMDQSNDENGLSLAHPKAWASFALIDGR